MPTEQVTPEAPSIAEKVRFWEEQDRINQALIPRVVQMHEILVTLQQTQSTATEAMARLEARAVAAEKELQSIRAELQLQQERTVRLEADAANLVPGPSPLAVAQPPDSAAGGTARLLSSFACGVAAISVVIAVAGYGAIAGGLAVLASTFAVAGVIRR